MRGALLILAALASASCVEVGRFETPDAGVDGPLACFRCHADKEEPWSHPSSHRLLFRCEDCHAYLSAYGPGHAVRRPCSNCHSEQAHPAGAECTGCHTPHGSANAFLLKESIVTPAGSAAQVHVTKAEGASPEGLVRAGVDGQPAGSGLCEVCHRATGHYNSAGTAAPHESGWCGRCHSHQRAFAPGAPGD